MSKGKILWFGFSNMVLASILSGDIVSAQNLAPQDKSRGKADTSKMKISNEYTADNRKIVTKLEDEVDGVKIVCYSIGAWSVDAGNGTFCFQFGKSTADSIEK